LLDKWGVLLDTQRVMFVADGAPQNLGLLLIAASAIGFYIAARVAVDSLTNLDNPSASRLALAHWLPVALLAMVAVITGNAVIAVCVTLGTSVAALTLNLGLVTATTGDEVSAGEFSRAWPLVVPAALITFVAGFSAHLNGVHAVVLAIEAVMVAMVWFAPRGEFALRANESPSPLPSPGVPREGVAAPMSVVDPLTPRRYLTFVLAMIISIFGAIVGVYGALRMSLEIPLTTPGLIAAVGLSPLLVLPMIGTGTLLAERGHPNAAASSLVGVTLLNLCVLLPLLVATWLVRREILRLPDAPASIPFPMAAWRVDTVLILIMGAVLIPVAVGRWRLGRFEGVVLVIAYAAYLGVNSILGVRW
jgi:cation:H+ antiporter